MDETCLFCYIWLFLSVAGRSVRKSSRCDIAECRYRWLLSQISGYQTTRALVSKGKSQKPKADAQSVQSVENLRSSARIESQPCEGRWHDSVTTVDGEAAAATLENALSK